MDTAWNILTNPNARFQDRLLASTVWTATAVFGYGALHAAALTGPTGSSAVAYSGGYEAYNTFGGYNNTATRIIAGYGFGYENIRQDMQTINSNCAPAWQKWLAGGDATLNAILGISMFKGLSTSARSVMLAQQLKGLSAAERLVYLEKLGSELGVDVLENEARGAIPYRPLGQMRIVIPTAALDDAGRLAGTFYHELAHVTQEFTMNEFKFKGLQFLQGQSTELARGLQVLSTKLEKTVVVYPFNPVEVEAFASGLTDLRNNVAWLAYVRLLLGAPHELLK